MPLPNSDVDFYLVIEDFGASCPSFLETDLVQADRDTIVRNFISGQYEDALRVVSFNVAEGWSRDVSEDIAGESSIAPTMRTRRLPTTPSDSSICILIISVDRGRHRCYASKIRSSAEGVGGDRHRGPCSDTGAMGIRTRRLNINGGAAKLKADWAARLEAGRSICAASTVTSAAGALP
jgi:hypothetical protein